MQAAGSPLGWRGRIAAAGAGVARAMATPWAYAYVVAVVVGGFAVAAAFASPLALYALDPVLFFPVFVVHLYQRRSARLIGLTSLWGVWRSVLLIVAVAFAGDALDGLVAGGPEYHADTLRWIRFNEGEIAHPEVFTWEHAGGLWRVALSGAGSAGLTTLVAGGRELNLMNYHVAKLFQSADRGWPIACFGWPVWSILRGWAYLFVVMGTGPVFFDIVRRRRPRWRALAPWLAAGCLLAAVDLGLKIALAPAWRHLILLAWH